MATELKFDEVLRVLTHYEVEFIVVGGVAAILQGSPLTTEDVDVVYLPSEENIARLVGALAELEAHYFDPAGRHIEPNASRLASMRMHLLKTNCGRVDVLRTVGKDLAHHDLVERSRVFDVAEFRLSTQPRSGRGRDTFLAGAASRSEGGRTGGGRALWRCL